MDTTLPAVHVLQIAELLGLLGIPPAELFAGFDVSEASLSEPGRTVPIKLAEQITERARDLSGEPGIGFYLGLQMRVSAHGDVGLAAMTAATVREALDIAIRFAPTRTTAIALRWEMQDDKAVITIEERVPLGKMRDVLLFALVVGLREIGHALTGKEIRGEADFTFDEPEYFRRFADQHPDPLRFSQPENRILFDPEVLDRPIKWADRSAQRIAKEQCERALEALGPQALLVSRVRSFATTDDGAYRSLEEVAQKLHLSDRTLKRKLRARGTSFSEILDELKHKQALVLVRSPDLAFEEIADRLGYSDPANFTRAFRRWTGKTPRAYRDAESAD